MVEDSLLEKVDQPAGIKDYKNNTKVLCVCVCMCMYIHIYTYTHIYIQYKDDKTINKEL